MWVMFYAVCCVYAVTTAQMFRAAVLNVSKQHISIHWQCGGILQKVGLLNTVTTTVEFNQNQMKI